MASKVVARRSKVHGKGLFAAQDLKAGERLIEYTGKRYEKGYLPEMGDDGITRYVLLSDGSGIDGSGWASLANHGCTPNCELLEEDDPSGRPRLWLFALKKIAKGEELVWDYRLEVKSKKEAFSDWACACGARNCRGTMADTGSFADAEEEKA
jgi:SET domain-containing protein